MPSAQDPCLRPLHEALHSPGYCLSSILGPVNTTLTLKGSLPSVLKGNQILSQRTDLRAEAHRDGGSSVDRLYGVFVEPPVQQEL